MTKYYAAFYHKDMLRFLEIPRCINADDFYKEANKCVLKARGEGESDWAIIAAQNEIEAYRMAERLEKNWEWAKKDVCDPASSNPAAAARQANFRPHLPVEIRLLSRRCQDSYAGLAATLKLELP